MNRMYEAEQAESLQSNRNKCRSANDWQTKEIDKLRKTVSELMFKLEEAVAECDKAICGSRVNNGWEFVNAKKAVLLSMSGERVINVDLNNKQIYRLEDVSLGEINDDAYNLYLHSIKEG